MIRINNMTKPRNCAECLIAIDISTVKQTAMVCHATGKTVEGKECLAVPGWCPVEECEDDLK